MKLAVFVSGKGTNLFNIIKKNKDGFLKSEVVVVISDHVCEALVNAERAGIETKRVDPKNFPSEIEFGNSLLDVLKKCDAELIVLAGFLKKIPDIVVKSFENKIINIHPALLPSFGGKGMYGMKVHEAVIDYGCKVSGATVHIVDTEYDRGPVPLQKCVPVTDHDTPAGLAEKIHQLEYELLPEAIKLFEEKRVKVVEYPRGKGRKVFIL